MKGTEPQPPHQGNRAHVNRLAPRKPAVDTGHSCSAPGLLCATGLRPGDPVPPPWRGSGHGGAQQRPYLSLWHGGEAQFPVGDEGVLHRVHRETVEGGLGAHVVLKAFDHSTIEPAPNGGPSASLAAVARCPAAWGTSFPRVPPRLSPRLRGDHPSAVAAAAPAHRPHPHSRPQGAPCELGTPGPGGSFLLGPLGRSVPQASIQPVRPLQPPGCPRRQLPQPTPSRDRSPPGSSPASSWARAAYRNT